MPLEIILPKVDMDMSHGTLAIWHATEGEWVQQGAPLFDIETDKAAMEVEAPATGYLHQITAHAGDKVAVGTTIALLYAEGEAVNAVTTATPSDQQGLQPTEVILPKVDMDMTHGTLALWHVAEGALVNHGAALFDIETDKAAMEVESPATGRLFHITAKPGDKIPVGSTLAWIYPEGMAAGQAPRCAPSALVVAAQSVAQKIVVTAVNQTIVAQPAKVATGLGIRATPAARKALRHTGLTLAEVTGTGPLGRVQKSDVIDLLAPRPASPAKTGWNHESGPLYVSRHQGTGKPILFLHGFTADSQSWGPLEKALGAKSPLLRIDLPGHGKSPKRHLKSFQDLSRMVVDTFDEATQDSDEVHLVGHSLGAALGLALADIRGRRIASLTLLAPAGLGPEIDAAALNGIVRASRVESLAPWLRRLTATPEGISDDYARAAFRARAESQLRSCQEDMAQALFPDGVQAFDLRSALKRIECPLQIIWGRSDHILPHTHGIRADGEFALHLLTGAGHIPQIECPERVARIINTMIRSVETLG